MKTRSRCNPVIVPNALAPKQCAIENGLAAGESVSEVVNRCVRQFSKVEGFILDLLLTNGCRIGEALAVRPGDILTENSVHIRGEKGSSDRVCFLTVVQGFQTLQDIALRLNGPGMNRWYIYRVARKMGIYGKLIGKQRNAVTHLGRHNFVSRLAHNGVDTVTIQKVIGHKSVKSTKYYEENEVE